MQPHGGISRVAFELARRLHERGVDIETITGELPGEESSLIPVGTIRQLKSIAWLMRRLRGYLKINITVVVFSLLSSRIFHARRLDSISLSHGDSLTGDIFVAHSCHWAAVHAKIKNRQWRWLFNPMHWFVLAREAWITRRRHFQYLVAISHEISTEYQHYHRVPVERIRVISNGVDTQSFTPDSRSAARLSVLDELGLSGGMRILLFAGHEFGRKGLSELIRALPLIRTDEGIALLVLGRDHQAPYKMLADENNVSAQVYFLGARLDIERYMAAADLFVLPAYYEPFGLVCMEALASGTPVLATKTGGIIDYLENGVNGLFIEPDPGDIAAKITLLLTDPARMHSMGAAARKTAEQFSWDTVAAHYLELIHQVAEEKMRGAVRC